METNQDLRSLDFLQQEEGDMPAQQIANLVKEHGSALARVRQIKSIEIEFLGKRFDSKSPHTYLSDCHVTKMKGEGKTLQRGTFFIQLVGGGGEKATHSIVDVLFVGAKGANNAGHAIEEYYKEKE